MKLKRTVALLLCFALFCAPCASARDYSEAPSWAQDAYANLEENGIDLWWADVDGDCDRASFARGLVEIIEAVVPGEILANYPPASADFFADHASNYVLQAVGYGILEGSLTGGVRYADQGATINREQAAKMTVSAIDFFERVMCEVAPQGEPAVYADASAISAWAVAYTNRIAAYQIMIGDGEGNFDPSATLSWPQAVIIMSRTFDNLRRAILESTDGVVIESGMDWSNADDFGGNDNQVSKPKTGRSEGHYISADADGVITAVVVPRVEQVYDYDLGEWQTITPNEFSVEKYDADGNVIFSKTVPFELPIFGAFLAGEDCYYVAYGRENDAEDDTAETFRIAKYDGEWNLVGYASANGGETYTTIPFRSAVARMALNDDGSTLVLHAARQRYTSDDGLRHQSNITFILDTATMEFSEVWGGEFPTNHVSHSFGQFVRFDGDIFYMVDHGDAYPRSFFLQDSSGETVRVPAEQEGWYYIEPKYAMDLFEIYGAIGANVTGAIGSGFEISSDGFLFLLCSDTQQGLENEPWNVYLVYVDKEFESRTIIPLENSDTHIDTARLVKLDDDTFAAMWADGADIRVQLVDGTGNNIGGEQVFEGLPMPPTEPVVTDGEIVWLQEDPNVDGAVKLYRIAVQ